MLKLTGAPNFRDLGGYATVDGRTVRAGFLFRSEGFHALTARDRSLIADARFRLRCDLRSDAERQTTPCLWPDCEDPAGILLLDLGADPRAANQLFFDHLKADFSTEGAFHAMCTLQSEMPHLIGRQLTALFDRIIEQGRIPAVFHCHHGKDRTGFVAAILLRALGVPVSTVIEDYMKTNLLIDRAQSAKGMRDTLLAYAGREPSPAMIERLVNTDPAYLMAALDRIDHDHGDVPSYLASQAGLDSERLRKFQDLMLA